MSDLTARQKGLLVKLFSPDNIKTLSTLIDDSSDSDWSDLYTALISDKSDNAATVYIDGASELHNSTAGIGGIFLEMERLIKSSIPFQKILARLPITRQSILPLSEHLNWVMNSTSVNFLYLVIANLL